MVVGRILKSDKAWLLGLLAASILTINYVDCFHFVPSGSVFKKAAFSKSSLRMLPLDWQPSDQNGRQSSSVDGDEERRTREFLNLEPLPESKERKARLERDLENQAQFAKYGDELWNLRKNTKKLGEKLAEAIDGGSREDAEFIRHQLREYEQQDPELVYEMELLELKLAQRGGDSERAEDAGRRALAARSCLPQYNLEGLWVGK